MTLAGSDPNAPAGATCPSCGSHRPGRFCPDCGERAVTSHEFGLFHFLGQVFTGLTTFDGKLLGSLRRLLFQPGELTRDWIRGARVKHLRPVQLFLLVNLLVVVVEKWWSLPGFFSSSLTSDFERWQKAMAEQAALLGVSESDYQVRYEAASSSIARNTVSLMIPMVAAVFFLFNFVRERRAGVLLVLAAHQVAFMLLVVDLFLGTVVFRWARHAIPRVTGVDRSIVVEFLLLLDVLVQSVWWYIATRRALGIGRVMAFLQAVLAPLLSWLLVLVAHQAIVHKLTLNYLGR